jgi:hypothetical protein
MANEMILRDVGGYSEAEIALLLDPQTHADKRTMAETSATIQDIMMGRTPRMNYNATAYFMQMVLDFVTTHQDDPKIQKKLPEFMAYLEKHQPIALQNEQRRAKTDARAMGAPPAAPGNPMGAGGQPANTNVQPEGGAAADMRTGAPASPAMAQTPA